MKKKNFEDERLDNIESKITELINEFNDLKIMVEDMERNIMSQIEYLVGVGKY